MGGWFDAAIRKFRRHTLEVPCFWGAIGFVPLGEWTNGSTLGLSPSSPMPALGLGLMLFGTTISAVAAVRAKRISHRMGDTVESLQSMARRKEAELCILRQELSDTRRMHTLGLLSASLAHDLNNQLSAVRMSNKLIARAAPANPDIQKRVRTIEHSIQHTRDLIDSLLGADRRGDANSRVIDLRQEVDGVLELVREEFLESTELEVALPAVAMPVGVSPVALRRILLNLVINAGEAMDRGGTLRIRAETTSAVSIESLLLCPAASLSWIRLSVIDTGPGIAAAALDRLFDPTFSTKPRESRIGTGLGLYIVHALAVEEGIGLGIESRLGGGTRFDLYLPEPWS